MKFKVPVKMLASLASFFVLVAPALSQKNACAFFWGEPECPECLKGE